MSDGHITDIPALEIEVELGLLSTVAGPPDRVDSLPQTVSSWVTTTQWSQVLAARDGSETEARRALVGLCQTYWQPLYAYVRRQGADPEQALDLTQGYFAELLEKDFLAEVDPSKGRFRSFLLASLRHYLSHERAKSRRLKRGGGVPNLSLDLDDAEAHYSIQAVEPMTPEDVFERRWAVTVLGRALDRLEMEAHKSQRDEQFQLLKPYLTGELPQPAYRQVGEILGMKEGAVKVAVHRLRRRFGNLLRIEIADTVADPAEVDTEVRHLLKVLRA